MGFLEGLEPELTRRATEREEREVERLGKRKQEEEAQERIRQEMEWALGVFDRLGVVAMLEKIKREVWRGGIVSVKEYHDPKERHKTSIYTWVEGRSKHASLTYEYQEPWSKYEEVYERRFGFHKERETYWANTQLPGDSYQVSGSERTKFGRHLEHVGYRLVLDWSSHSENLYLYVGCTQTTKLRGSDDLSFNLESGLHVSGFAEGTLSLTPRVDDATIKNFLETNLLQDCVLRKEAKRLPYQIDIAMQEKLARVNQEISRNSK
ncbi:hypothetical protein HYU45_04555 [Candidatus Daviesbacteria bacterium]|nr:hypothetical protein [Candidatus Daviesbacteria bacterium]